jgi:uncharacterized BrkB/YihY/UPF0761 family membrane protein
MAPMEAATRDAGLLAAHELQHAPLVVQAVVILGLLGVMAFGIWLMVMIAKSSRQMPRRKMTSRDKKILVVGMGTFVLFMAAGFAVGYAMGSPSGPWIAGGIGALMGAIAHVIGCWVVGGFIFADALKKGRIYLRSQTDDEHTTTKTRL